MADPCFFQHSESASNMVINPADIAKDLRNFEIPQKPYIKGLRKDEVPTQRVSYFPGGFTPATILREDLTQISEPDDTIPAPEGKCWPEKTRFYLEFCNAAYNTPVISAQRRVRLTRGEFAIRASEEIEKLLAQLPQFPFALDQIRVLCIDVRSRGTVQARIFVDGYALETDRVKNLADMLRI